MEWTYKNIKITVCSDGAFIFRYKDSEYTYYSLNEAKSKIDSLVSGYYTFTQKDMDKLMKKLDNREKELVRSLYKELKLHMRSNYCEMGIIEEFWVWDWNFDK